MTEIRRSTAEPCPPPHAKGASYCEHQINVRKAICRACQRVYMVPVRIAAEDFVCSGCADGH